MNLTKENVKKICGIILFTVVVLVIVQNYEKVGNAIGLLWGIIFPFVLGGIIAFILNIPMRAIEKLLFKSKNGKQKKYARPLSMIITFLLVIGVIAGVILIVVPQIGGTVRELTKSAEAFFPKVPTIPATASAMSRYNTVPALRLIKIVFHDLRYGTPSIPSIFQILL